MPEIRRTDKPIEKEPEINKKISFGSIRRSTIEVKELPSKRLPYPNSMKLYYHPYTYREIDEFNDSSVNVADGLRFILKGIDVKNMDIYDLTLADFLYVALLRKISSLGTSQFQVTIKTDEYVKNVVFNFDQIEFDDLDIPDLPIITTLGGHELHFMPLTVGRYLDLLEKDQTDERSLMAAQIINHTFCEAKDLVDNSSCEDIVTLKEIDNYLFHGVRPLTITFEHEGRRISKTVAIDDPQSLVWPFCGNKAIKGSAIRFGLQEHS